MTRSRRLGPGGTAVSGVTLSGRSLTKLEEDRRKFFSMKDLFELYDGCAYGGQSAGARRAAGVGWVATADGSLAGAAGAGYRDRLVRAGSADRQAVSGRRRGLGQGERGPDGRARDGADA